MNAMKQMKEVGERRILKSGSVFMGTCGEQTDLYDSNGNNLRVGDLVAIWTQDVEDRGWNDEPAYVVKEEGEEPFIMGLKSSRRVREYILDGEVSDEEHYDTILDTYSCDRSDADSTYLIWNVIRIKTFDKTVDGERWSCVYQVTDNE